MRYSKKAVAKAPDRTTTVRDGRTSPAVVAVLLGAAGILVAVATLLPGASSWPKSLVSGSAEGFNVLLVTFDTTRADHIGCYGHAGAQTPVLDRLSQGGIRFDDAVTVAPMTLPSHTTIHTGLVPPNHGLRNNGEFTLEAEHETLAEILKSRGYQTSAFVSAFVLDAQFGLDQGFETYDDSVESARQQPGGLLHKTNERTAGATTDEAIRWLNERDTSRPFFSWVHYYDPHRPFAAPPSVAKRFANSPYDAEIAYTDMQLGRLIQALRQSGSLARTLLFVVGDHGEGLGDHGEEAHSTLIYDSVMRVPLIMSCPKLFGGPHVVDEVVVSVADVFPTVLDLLNIPHKSPIDGQSLLTARSDVDRTVYMENLATYFDNGWAPLYGLRRHGEKYILAPTPEFYSLRSDPGELDNIYRNAAGDSLRVRDQLVLDLNARLAASPTLDDVLASVQPLEGADLQALQSLGYVGSVTDAGDPDTLADPKDMMPVLQAIGRANTLSAQRQYAQALSVLEGALVLSPKHRKLPLMMGQLHLYLGHLEEAMELLQGAMPDMSATQVAIVAAQTLSDAAQPELAVDVLERARASAPGDVDVLVRLGVAYLQSGRHEDALIALREAEQLDDSRLETSVNLAACYRRLGNQVEALRYAERVIEISPDTAQAHLTRGLILKELNQNEEALASLSTALELDAQNPMIRQELANVCMRLRLFSDAADHFRALAALLPTRWEPHLGLGSVYYLSGEIDKAIAEVRAGLKMAPNEPRLRALAQRLAEHQD